MLTWIASWWSGISTNNYPTNISNNNALSDEPFSLIEDSSKVKEKNKIIINQLSDIQEISSKVTISNAPARNAPNNGKNIRNLIEHKPVHITLISEAEIKKALSNLKQPVIVTHPPLPQRPTLLSELNELFLNTKDSRNPIEVVRERRQHTKV